LSCSLFEFLALVVIEYCFIFIATPKNSSMKKVIISFIVVAVFLVGGWLYWGTHDATPAVHPETKYAMWAFIIGAIVTISLPIGAITGLTLKPGAKVTAIMTAFGAGALLAALSVELIAPTVMDIVGQSGTPEHAAHEKSHALVNMGSLLIGCVAGGFLFYTLDELVNSKGGIIRKVGSYVNFVKKTRKDCDITEQEFSHADIHEKEAHQEGGAPMAIWLGLLIDGIPESFVIGAGFLALLAAKQATGVDPGFTDVLPYTLIAGLFLSNFPEALAASLGMKKSGLSTTRILMLWMSLVLIIAVGSLAGYYIGSSIPHEIEIGIEGLAAGAMLTMIGQTMIPEAVHLGGTKVVGLSTLIGYLGAVAFKIFE
jgi:zinc transporter, ZIP family